MIFKPTTFFIIVQTSFGLELEIQLIPIMQVYIKVDVTYKQKTNGKKICILKILFYNSKTTTLWALCSSSFELWWNKLMVMHISYVSIKVVSFIKNRIMANTTCIQKPFIASTFSIDFLCIPKILNLFFLLFFV